MEFTDQFDEWWRDLTKSGEWNAWYDRMVPIADDLFDEHVRELALEGDHHAQDPEVH